MRHETSLDRRRQAIDLDTIIVPFMSVKFITGSAIQKGQLNGRPTGELSGAMDVLNKPQPELEMEVNVANGPCHKELQVIVHRARKDVQTWDTLFGHRGLLEHDCVQNMRMHANLHMCTGHYTSPTRLQQL